MSQKKSSESEENLWKIHMQTLMKRKKNMEIAQIIDDVLYKYYTIELGKPVPNWKTCRNPDWWIEYLTQLGINPNNP
jgi:hypothetical protein